MPRIRGLLLGGAVGAMAAYFLDPGQGAARRAHVRNQVEGLGRDLRDRAMAAIGRAEPPVVRPPADDDLSLLCGVERALLGLPEVGRGSVETEVVDRQVVLRGEVATVELARVVVAAAAGVPGVTGVESQLQVVAESKTRRP